MLWTFHCPQQAVKWAPVLELLCNFVIDIVSALVDQETAITNEYITFTSELTTFSLAQGGLSSSIDFTNLDCEKKLSSIHYKSNFQENLL